MTWLRAELAAEVAGSAAQQATARAVTAQRIRPLGVWFMGGGLRAACPSGASIRFLVSTLL